MKIIFSLLCLIVVMLVNIVSVAAVPTIAMDCDGKTDSPGVDATAECTELTPTVTISYYLTDVQPSDNLDQIAVRLDYDNSLLLYSSTGLNIGLGRSEFMVSGGGTAIPAGIVVDSNTVDTSVAISGDCVADGTCPSGTGNMLKVTFDCMDYGTVYCTGASPSFTIVDTRNIETTKTSYAHYDLEHGGEKKLFSKEEISGEEIIFIHDNSKLSFIRRIVNWFVSLLRKR